MAETCYRHPDRETARLLLLLRAADLPRLHDPDPGRDALPGVHAAADQGGAGGGRRRRPASAPSRRPIVLIAINVDRLPGRDRRRRRRAQRPGGNSIVDRLRALRPVGRRRRVVPAGHQRLPPRRVCPHRLQHVRCSSSSAGCWSRRWARRASSPSTSPRCWPVRSGRCCSIPTRSPSAPRGRSSAWPAPTFVIARGRGMDAIAGEIGVPDRLQSGLQLACARISLGGHIGGLVGGAALRLAIVAGERACSAPNRLPAEFAVDGRGRRGLGLRRSRGRLTFSRRRAA